MLVFHLGIIYRNSICLSWRQYLVQCGRFLFSPSCTQSTWISNPLSCRAFSFSSCSSSFSIQPGPFSTMPDSGVLRSSLESSWRHFSMSDSRISGWRIKLILSGKRSRIFSFLSASMFADFRKLFFYILTEGVIFLSNLTLVLGRDIIFKFFACYFISPKLAVFFCSKETFRQILILNSNQL